MPEPTSKTSSDNTFEIKEELWTGFLAEFTRENSGAHAVLEVLSPEDGRLVEEDNHPFEGISADVKDGESEIWITFGSIPTDHHAHGVQKVTELWVRPP